MSIIRGVSVEGWLIAINIFRMTLKSSSFVVGAKIFLLSFFLPSVRSTIEKKDGDEKIVCKTGFFPPSFGTGACVCWAWFLQPNVPVFAEWVFGDNKKRQFKYPNGSSCCWKWQAGQEAKRRRVEPKIIPPVLFRSVHPPFATTTTTTTRWRDGRCPNTPTWSSAKSLAYSTLLERGKRELLVLENSTICGFKLLKWDYMQTRAPSFFLF